MARYEQAYSGERRTSALHVQLTPGERAEIETAAGRAGVASLSAYARLLLFHRLAEFELFASPQRNPDVRRLIFELSAIGNNITVPSPKQVLFMINLLGPADSKKTKLRCFGSYQVRHRKM